MSGQFWQDRASGVMLAWLKCLDAAQTPIPIPDSCAAFDNLVRRAAEGEFGAEAFSALKELCGQIPAYDVTAAIDGFQQQSVAYRVLGPIILTLSQTNRQHRNFGKG